MEERKIRGFRDLEVYQRTYQASIDTMKKILPLLPDSEKYDLRDHLSRSCKAVPRLIAEGYAKRHQKRGFQKYLDDAMGECNETVVSLSQCRDLYEENIDVGFCDQLIGTYDISGRQLYRLEESWLKSKGKNLKEGTA